MYSTVLAGLFLTQAVLAFDGGADEFRAGEDSLRYQVDIGKDEQRGPDTAESPRQVKRQLQRLLERLRGDGTGLKPDAERNIESFFTVADAFEADGRLAGARDVLVNLQENLEALIASRAGKPRPDSLIRSEADLLAYRDAHNIHLITPHYAAGGQPGERGYRWLKSKGFTTVINLREAAEHEREFVESLGLRYVHIPWPDLQPPSMDQVTQIVAVVEAEQKKGGKVFQHCLRGIGRDGTMVCCVRVAGGMSAEQAIAEWLKAAPTWLDDQARDKAGQPVQLNAVRQFELEKKSKDAKPKSKD